MTRPPPTSTLFPYTTLFRSAEPVVRDDLHPAHARLADRGRRAYHARIERGGRGRSEEHTSELQSHVNLVCRLLLEKKKQTTPSGRPFRLLLSPFRLHECFHY